MARHGQSGAVRQIVRQRFYATRRARTIYIHPALGTDAPTSTAGRYDGTFWSAQLTDGIHLFLIYNTRGAAVDGGYIFEADRI